MKKSTNTVALVLGAAWCYYWWHQNQRCINLMVGTSNAILDVIEDATRLMEEVIPPESDDPRCDLPETTCTLTPCEPSHCKHAHHA